MDKNKKLDTDDKGIVGFFWEDGKNKSMSRLLMFLATLAGIVALFSGIIMIFTGFASAGQIVCYCGAGLIGGAIGGKVLTRYSEGSGYDPNNPMGGGTPGGFSGGGPMPGSFGTYSFPGQYPTQPQQQMPLALKPNPVIPVINISPRTGD